MPENESMKVLDLFSGIGGFSLGLERAGMETVAFCEIEKYPRSILKKHWPDVHCYDDVRELNAARLVSDGISGVDIICGGFPCQPFSIAGKQKGKDDDRHLWPEYFRLIQELHPKWIIGENVAGLISMGLDDVLSDLESEGYTWETFIIPACAVNAIHRRDRVWIVAHSQDMLRNGSEPDRENGRAQTSKSGGGDSEDAADASGDRLQGFSISGKGGGKGGGKPQGRETAGAGSARDEFKLIPIPTQSPVCARDDGISAELAGFGINRGKYVKGYYQVSEPEKGNLGWKVLRSMWENRNIAASSPELYIHRMRDSMPEMPYEVTHGGWLVGSRINENKGLCDMWECFYSKSYEESQDLQQRLFEQIRKIERDEKMASGQIDRVARLKALGNAVVPQIPEIIGREIMGIEGQCAKLE